jgi:hypothetical protein
MKSYKRYFRITGPALLLVIFIATNSVFAQNPFANQFQFENDDPRYFEQVKEKYKQSFDQDLYVEILKLLKKDFTNKHNLPDNDAKEYQTKFIDALDQFMYKLDLCIKNDSLDRIKGGFFELAQASPFGNPPLRYFAKYPEFEIEVTSSNLDTADAIDLRYRMNTLQLVADEITQNSRVALEKSLVRLNTQWDNFHFSAKSQYPWEFAANSLILKWGNKRPLVKPPSSQLIFLHPNVSLEMDFSNKGAFKANQFFNIEVAGMAWNFNNYEDYLAASFLFGFSNNLGNGYGGMFSYNGTQAGFVFHENTGKQVHFVLTLDLFKIIQNSKSQWGNIRN